MNILPKTCLCERWSPHKTTTLIKKSDKHLSYFVSRMSFGCNLFFFFFFTPGCCQREQEAANICSRPTYVCRDSEQTRLRILDRLKDKTLRSSQLLLYSLVCVWVRVCVLAVAIFWRPKCLFYYQSNDISFVLWTGLVACLHLPLWSFFPLVFFFIQVGRGCCLVCSLLTCSSSPDCFTWG